MKSCCRGRGIDAVDPLPEFEATAAAGAKLTLPNDHHWSPRGHELAAQSLFTFLKQENLLANLGKPAPGTR